MTKTTLLASIVFVAISSIGVSKFLSSNGGTTELVSTDRLLALADVQHRTGGEDLDLDTSIPESLKLQYEQDGYAVVKGGIPYAAELLYKKLSEEHHHHGTSVGGGGGGGVDGGGTTPDAATGNNNTVGNLNERNVFRKLFSAVSTTIFLPSIKIPAYSWCLVHE